MNSLNFSVLAIALLAIASSTGGARTNSTTIIGGNQGRNENDCDGGYVSNTNCCQDKSCCISSDGNVFFACNNIPVVTDLDLDLPLGVLPPITTTECGSGTAQCDASTPDCRLIPVTISNVLGSDKSETYYQQICCSANSDSANTCTQASNCVGNGNGAYTCCADKCSGASN